MKQNGTELIKYGSKGQAWAPEFVAYMSKIVSHPAYADMPDAIKEDGKIQWEAPSNREGGKYQYTYNKRLEWWKQKAQSIGIDTNQNQWISRTAKIIHPTKEKPCKRCGQTMKIGYYYPTSNLIKRFLALYGENFEISPTETITSVVERVYSFEGDKLFKQFSTLFLAKNISVPTPVDLADAIRWLENEYIPLEPSTLSPGAMSNAPDRFDGFHSFNKCCRHKADTGRHTENLKTYTSDRRVFEFWSEGNWAAADRLMGLIKTQFKNEACADGGDGPPTADHIGPLSLGFCHRPEFQLLSRSANSAKNNRMTLSDVQNLLATERRGERVISWYAVELWNRLKFTIKTDEDALILSKMLRDNQRIAMHILWLLFANKKFTFLASLLELKHAEYNYDFICLHVDKFITSYERLEASLKSPQYAAEQKSRRIRIAFEALYAYGQKDNRHRFILHEDEIHNAIENVLVILQDPILLKIDAGLESLLYPSTGILSDLALREYINSLPCWRIPSVYSAQEVLASTMNMIGKSLSEMRDNPRYTREIFDLND